MESQAERCVPWEPVPSAANRYMVLNVAFVEQAGLIGPIGDPVSVVVGASLDDAASGTHSVLAWRLTFQFVAGYNMLPIGRWSGVLPYEFTADGKRLPLRIATWEVLNSRWLAAHVTPLHLVGRHLHHFVIASSEEVFEIAAASWETRDLGAWAQVRQGLEARWAHDHPPVSLSPPASES